MIERIAKGSAAIVAACGLVGVAVCSLSGTAMAATCATISVSPASPTIRQWNPINPAAQEATFSIQLTRTQASTKSARLILLDADSSARPLRVGTTSGPRYEIVNTDTGQVISYPVGTSVGALTIPLTQFGAGSAARTVVHAKLRILANSSPVEDFRGGQRFFERLDYAAQCFKANGQSNGIDDRLSAGLTAELTIPRIASIVTAAPSTIDFGNFTTLSQQALVTVKSTATLNVSVDTANRGKLVLDGAVSPYPVNSFIPYSMTFNNRAVLPGTRLFNQARAGVTGSSYPLVLSLTGGIPSGKLAGTYQDTITVTITPGQ